MAEKPKILVVEDEPSLRLLVRKVLERSGFAVMEAASGVPPWNCGTRTSRRLIFC